MSDDLHTPTTAAPEPTPVVTESDATAARPAGTAAPPYAALDSGAGAESPAERPEVQAAAAFAGGLVLAFILKRLGR
ncbi:MAG: hypothetical protein ACXVSX_16210 [Solirubrobacteraceae bacterium]